MHLLLLAIAPATVIILYIYFKDKFEKEPIPFLFKNFLLGATASVLITVILGGFADKLFPITEVTNIFQQFIKAFIVVAFVEEFSKYVIVKYFAQRNKEYNEPFDGIVYAVMVSMGFATLENVLYVFQHGVSTGVIRAFTAVPAHATFAILMGYFMGKAKFSKNRIALNLAGLFFAVLFHGAYDFFLFINFIPGISIGAFISLILGIVLSRKAIKKHQNSSVFKV
ncbi:PrsW family glutamic-type intramembrane protease [Polaribacter sp. Z014]|uniref:PrsW family intramembrane metalloprotease n=1 Tax=unclassified Polaribacter TaxID=196858 RepID=UPI00193C10F7|nr:MULTISPECIES: PrsW family glutamic-type intramembrane protease [unclassified Polaribacter]MCL7763313.1 PrsW family glutamic-type intramembrane protease [Polaribacter sp. Z014]QVY67257.1 PrsW family intramembrane metalloprotease [Polaribacter sp. Q13]